MDSPARPAKEMPEGPIHPDDCEWGGTPSRSGLLHGMLSEMLPCQAHTGAQDHQVQSAVDDGRVGGNPETSLELGVVQAQRTNVQLTNYIQG